jgi:putative transposase
MARPLRIEFAGALYHVTSRGNARASIFLEDADRHRFLERLGEMVATYRWECHAYCLMTNHFHLLVGTPEPNLSAGMRRLNGFYAQWFNDRHGRVGHVLQGRFTAIVVEREAHLAELARYVVLNPVRAGMVRSPERYEWSSLRAAVGLAPAPPWLDCRSIVERFGSPRRYLEFVHEGIGGPSPWADREGVILGSEAFADRLTPRIAEKSLEPEHTRGERLCPRPSLAAVFTPADCSTRSGRDARIREVARSGRYSIAEIGRFLGLHYSTVSKIASAPLRPAARRQLVRPLAGGAPSDAGRASSSNSRFKI